MLPSVTLAEGRVITANANEVFLRVGGRRPNRSAPFATNTKPDKDSQVLTGAINGHEFSKRKVEDPGEFPHPKQPE